MPDNKLDKSVPPKDWAYISLASPRDIVYWLEQHADTKEYVLHNDTMFNRSYIFYRDKPVFVKEESHAVAIDSAKHWQRTAGALAQFLANARNHWINLSEVQRRAIDEKLS